MAIAVRADRQGAGLGGQALIAMRSVTTTAGLLLIVPLTGRMHGKPRHDGERRSRGDGARRGYPGVESCERGPRDHLRPATAAGPATTAPGRPARRWPDFAARSNRAPAIPGPFRVRIGIQPLAA